MAFKDNLDDSICDCDDIFLLVDEVAYEAVDTEVLTDEERSRRVEKGWLRS